MPEISQSTPIKPAWPVKRDDPRQQHPESESSEKNKAGKKKSEKQSPELVNDGGGKHPQIDDYA